MIFTATGQVEPGFFVLGAAETPVYMVDASQPALFDAGFACLGPAYQADISRTLAGREPAYLCLTHVHFDHCGSVAWLKRAFPGLKVAGSARAGEILARPGALALIGKLNEQVAHTAQEWGYRVSPQARFEPFSLDLVLGEGDVLPLGPELSLQVLATPGHTRDFLSYYIPERGILIASEAVGCADASGWITTEFLVDYDLYAASLTRLAQLKPRILCQGHRQVYTGEDVQIFLARSLAAAGEFKARVEELLQGNGGDVERVVGLVKAQEYDHRPPPKQPEPAYLLNLTARVRHLAGRLGLGQTSQE